MARNRLTKRRDAKRWGVLRFALSERPVQSLDDRGCCREVGFPNAHMNNRAPRGFERLRRFHKFHGLERSNRIITQGEFGQGIGHGVGNFGVQDSVLQNIHGGTNSAWLMRYFCNCQSHFDTR